MKSQSEQDIHNRSSTIRRDESDYNMLPRFKELAALEAPLCLHQLDSEPDGLTEYKVRERQDKYGLNIIHHKKSPAWYEQLLSAFVTPFNGILAIAAIVSLITDIWIAGPADREFKTVILVSVMILLSTLIRFWQEFRSNKAAEQLKSMIKTTATVLRQGEGRKEINIQQLVPGDIIFLSAGDMIPADSRVIHSKDLFVAQSILTGESLPVEKKDSPVANATTISLLDLENTCFMGTNVVSGSATAVIITTGDRTYFGTISRSLTGARTETSFEKGVNSVSWLLIRFIIVMVPMVFLINGLTKGNWFEAFLFAITVAVGLTPEMLPMIVTTNLAKGALSMSRRKVIVKQLAAIQNIGAMDVLCTDKTGTLTMDKIILKTHLNVFSEIDDEVLKWAYLNSYYQTGLKNLLDVAVLEHADLQHLLKVEERFKKIDEIPFEFERRRMSVILEQSDGRHLLICKGAAEEMLSICSEAFDPGDDRQLHIESDKVIPLDEQMRASVLQTVKGLNENGLRVLLIAIREFDSQDFTYTVNDESNLILAGFIGFLDPPKDSAKPSIEAMQKLGVTIKVLTGDNEVVTQKICLDVGILSDGMILTGTLIENMTDDELREKLKTIHVLAKLNPTQKSRIVNLLKENGHTVGYLGDGINDAIALRDADVGISVDSGTDIAKESADIILLEKDLLVLKNGIVYGRRTFGNIIKYIKMAASSNFGNMFSVLGASAFLPFLPMKPIQILTQNLLYDISQVSIPWDKMDKEFIEKPQKWNASGIARFMIFIGPVSSIFDYLTFAVLFFIFKANSLEHQSFFQTGWFIEGLLSQTLIVHMIRTRRIPFIQSWASAPVLALTTLIMAIGIFIPFSPAANALGMQHLPPIYFFWLAGILAGYCILTQLIKIWFIKRFKYWL